MKMDEKASVEVEDAGVAEKETKTVKNHKCLLKWKQDRMLSIFLNREKGSKILYPGWNTVDSDDILDIYNNNRDHFDRGNLIFKGINVDAEGKSYKENFQLYKASGADLSNMIKETHSRETLKDLSNPMYVSQSNIVIAKARQKELDEYKGVKSNVAGKDE